MLRKNQYTVAGRNIKQLFAGEASEETAYVAGTLTAVGTETLGLPLEDGTEMEFSMGSAVLDTEADLTEGLAVMIRDAD